MASRARARSTWAAGALSERLRRVKVFRSLGVGGRRGSFWRRDMGHLGARGSSHHYTKAHRRRPTSGFFLDWNAIEMELHDCAVLTAVLTALVVGPLNCDHGRNRAAFRSCRLCLRRP